MSVVWLRRPSPACYHRSDLARIDGGTVEETVCCRISLLLDTLLGSYKMVPWCNHLTDHHHVSVVGNFLPSYFSSTDEQILYGKDESNILVKIVWILLTEILVPSLWIRTGLSVSLMETGRDWYNFTVSAARPVTFPAALSLLSFLTFFSSCTSCLSSIYLHQHLLSFELSCRSDRSWARSIRKTNLGPLAHICAHAHTHTDTLPHPSFLALWPACLHSHRSASTLLNGFLSSCILLHPFSLCVTRNNKWSRPCARPCVQKQFFI